MATATPKKLGGAIWIVWMLVNHLFLFSAWPQQDTIAFVRPLANSISKSGERKVVIMPLAGPDGTIDALGAHLSQILSQALNASLPGIELVDPQNLRLPNNLGMNRH